MNKRTMMWVGVTVGIIIAALILVKFGKAENLYSTTRVGQEDFDWDLPGSSSINPF